MRFPKHLAKYLLLASLSLFSVYSLGHEEDSRESPEVDRTYIKAHFTKYEFEIPMRDGVNLFTAVYVPKNQSVTYPILLQRTPYGIRPYGSDNYPEHPTGQMRHYAKEGFIFAFQDVRGRYGSKGEFVHMRPHLPIKSPNDVDESTDSYDTIDWLVKNIPNNNGQVGMMGVSYPGFYTAAGMIDAHSALKCASPQAPIADWFVGDDFHHNGAFYLAHAFHFFSKFGQTLNEPTRQVPIPFDYKTPDGYEFYLNLGTLANINKKHFKNEITFWKELMEHGTYDEFWKARNLLPHLKNIRPAVMTVGGWFDSEDLYGPLSIYETVERTSPEAYNILIMGPWAHGDWNGLTGDQLGNIQFNQNTAIFYRNHIELPFLNHFLKDGKDPQLPDAYVFETGTNQWRRYDSWPPTNVKNRAFYFHSNGRLTLSPPTETGIHAFDEYTSDPKKPVPFIPNIAINMTREHMLDDQRFAASRPDVVVYTTDPLEKDITIAGPVTPSLYISTTGTDSDWVVKLIDVYPGDYPNPNPNPARVEMGGYQQLVRGEAIRGKFRNSLKEPEPFWPGKITQIEYVMPDAYHTFRRGHRIMVQIQSSWFPLIDRNPQKFVDIYKAKSEDFQKATQLVYRSAKTPSHVRVQVLN